jgi:hypothetical protein
MIPRPEDQLPGRATQSINGRDDDRSPSNKMACQIIRPSNGHLESSEEQFTIQRVALGELKTVAERREKRLPPFAFEIEMDGRW